MKCWIIYGYGSFSTHFLVHILRQENGYFFKQRHLRKIDTIYLIISSLSKVLNLCLNSQVWLCHSAYSGCGKTHLFTSGYRRCATKKFSTDLNKKTWCIPCLFSFFILKLIQLSQFTIDHFTKTRNSKLNSQRRILI